MENNSLYHHGVKGQKWYVRRYQNKDGTLTAAGKKRYAKELEDLKARERVAKNYQRTQAKIDALAAKRKEVEEAEALMKGEKKAVTEEPTKKESDSTPVSKAPEKPAKFKSDSGRQKSIKDMTDEELQARIDRINLEKRYAEAVKGVTPEKKKKTDSIVKEIAKNSIREIGTQTGKWLLGTGVNMLARKLGAEDDIVNPKKGQKDK